MLRAGAQVQFMVGDSIVAGEGAASEAPIELVHRLFPLFLSDFNVPAPP